MNSRAKGQRGERAWAEWLRTAGYPEARRGVQYQGGPDSPDVVGGIPGTHAEVKCVERLSVYAAMDQAVRDASAGAVPYVAHKRNRRPWLVIVRAEDLMAFVQAIQHSDACKMTEDELMTALARSRMKADGVNEGGQASE